MTKRQLLYICILLLTLLSCSFSPAIKETGVRNLVEISSSIMSGKSNKNDVIKQLGETILKEIQTDESWIYIETSEKNNYLGKKILLKYNMLIIKFNKFGIVENKIMLNRNDLKDFKYDPTTTTTLALNQSNVKKFFSSVKQRIANQQNK